MTWHSNASPWSVEYKHKAHALENMKHRQPGHHSPPTVTPLCNETPHSPPFHQSWSCGQKKMGGMPASSESSPQGTRHTSRNQLSSSWTSPGPPAHRWQMCGSVAPSCAWGQTASFEEHFAPHRGKHPEGPSPNGSKPAPAVVSYLVSEVTIHKDLAN